MPRLRKPNAAAIKRLCAAKRWGAGELAQKAELSPTTAYKAFNGDPMFRCKLLDIANALRVSIGDILDPDDPEATAQDRVSPEENPQEANSGIPKPKIVITVRIEGDADAISDSRLADMLNRFLQFVSSSTDIEPSAIRSGSIYVTLTMSWLSTMLSFEALARGTLEQFGIQAILYEPPLPVTFPFDDEGHRDLFARLAEKTNESQVSSNQPRIYEWHIGPVLLLLTAISEFVRRGVLGTEVLPSRQVAFRPTVPVAAPESPATSKR